MLVFINIIKIHANSVIPRELRSTEIFSSHYCPVHPSIQDHTQGSVCPSVELNISSDHCCICFPVQLLGCSLKILLFVAKFDLVMNSLKKSPAF